MKKSRIFLGIGTALLIVSAVFARKNARKWDAVPNTLYWNNGSAVYHPFTPGCLATIFTTNSTSYPATMYGYGIYWWLAFNPTTGIYAKVYLKQPLD